MICPHCEGNVETRNPNGFCDHLYYPDYCKICKKIWAKKGLIRTEIIAENNLNTKEN